MWSVPTATLNAPTGGIVPRDRNCTLCPLHAEATNVCIWAEGQVGAEIMFVGRNPGYDENRADRPFVGRAGDVLRKAAYLVGLSDDDIVYCNVNKCVSPDNRKPTVKEQKACRHYLDEEIETFQPKYVFAFGNEALSYFTGKQQGQGKEPGILTFYGGRMEIDGRWVFPMAHPSYILRQPGEASPDDRLTPAEREFRGYFQSNLTFIRNLQNGVEPEDTTPGGRPKVHICRTWAQVEKALAALQKCERIAVDTETMGLTPEPLCIDSACQCEIHKCNTKD